MCPTTTLTYVLGAGPFFQCLLPLELREATGLGFPLPVFRACPFYKPRPLIPPSVLCHAVRPTSTGHIIRHSSDISVKLFVGVGEGGLSQAICCFVSMPLALPCI